MWRFLGVVVGSLAAALALAFLLPISPLYMPGTECRPDRTRYDSAPMGASYAAIAVHMGCPGIKAREEDIGGVVKIDTYVWRADSWPVGIARLTFYNDTLQAKSETRLDLWIAAPKH